jgi:hypothetical protein
VPDRGEGAKSGSETDLGQQQPWKGLQGEEQTQEQAQPGSEREGTLGKGGSDGRVLQHICHAVPGWKGEGSLKNPAVQALNTKNQGACARSLAFDVNAIAGAARCSVAHQSGRPEDHQQVGVLSCRDNRPQGRSHPASIIVTRGCHG